MMTMSWPFSAIYMGAGFILVVMGALLLDVLWPAVAGLAAAAVALMLLATMRRFRLWQRLTFLALTCYIVFAYGFANFTVPHTPVPVGYLLLLAAVVLAAGQHNTEVKAFLREPACRWWLVLVGLSAAHLAIDLPRYGLMATRDASFVLEGIFLFLGYLWARQDKGTTLLRGLAVLFVVNLAYALTFPVADALAEVSPISGVFQEVPLLGSYAHMPLFLVAGALYYLLVARQVVFWPAGVLVGLAACQLSWSLVFQHRSMYIGVLTALGLLLLLGGVRRGAKVAAAFAGGAVIFFLGLSVSGLQLQGRVGDVDPEFLMAHLRGVLLDPTAPEEASAEWRLDLLQWVWNRWTASTTTVVAGEGFGEPLTNVTEAGGVAVRQPHNTHLTVLVRLGVFGFLAWMLLQWRILISLITSLRQSPRSTAAHDLALWLLLFYVLAVIFTSVQPWLEFSYGAIPFYVLMGFALGLARSRHHRVAA